MSRYSKRMKTLRFLSWDSNAEEQSVIDAVVTKAAKLKLSLDTPELQTVGELRAALLEPAQVTILSAHGGWYPKSKTDGEHEWRIFGRKGVPALTIEELLLPGDILGADVLILATCHGEAELWRRHLRPGAVAISRLGTLRHSATKHLISGFLCEFGKIGFSGPGGVEAAWKTSSDAAAKRAPSLRGSDYAFAYAELEGSGERPRVELGAELAQLI